MSDGMLAGSVQLKSSTGCETNGCTGRPDMRLTTHLIASLPLSLMAGYPTEWQFWLAQGLILVLAVNASWITR